MALVNLNRDWLTRWPLPTSLACLPTGGNPGPPAQGRAGPQPSAARRSRVNLKLNLQGLLSVKPLTSIT